MNSGTGRTIKTSRRGPHGVLARIVAAGFLGAALVGTATAQPGGSPGEPGRQPQDPGVAPRRPVPQPQGDGPAVEHPVVRAVLMRTAERTRMFLRRLEHSLVELDEGADPAEIRRGFETARREFMRMEREEAGRAGPDGPGPGSGPGQGPGPGGSMGPGGMGFEPGAGRPLSADERRAVREFLARERPELLRTLNALAPGEVGLDRLLESLGNRLRGLPDLKAHDPEMFDLRMREVQHVVEIGQARRAYLEALRTAPGEPERLSPLRGRLREAISASIEVGLQIRAREIEHLAARARHLNEELRQMKDNKDRIVDEQLRSMQRPLERRRQPGPPNIDDAPRPTPPAPDSRRPGDGTPRRDRDRDGPPAGPGGDPGQRPGPGGRDRP